MNHTRRWMKKLPTILAATWLVAALVPAATGEGFDELTVDELLGETVSPEALSAQIQGAVAAAAKARGVDPLLAPLDTLIRNPEVFLSPETMTSLRDALLAHGTVKDLAPRVPRLLAFRQVEFSPAATIRLNLGIALALRYGGATFQDLQALLPVQGVDLEWLLPALGKAGGASALPVLEPYRTDSTIISLNHPQNIAALPSAALLAAAYAGDEPALARILSIYEEDTANLPRFAFYVAWGLQEGLNVAASRHLVAHCRHRIDQAARLLDFLGRPARPRLIRQAVQTGSPALIGYLMADMQRAPAVEVDDFADLLDHPAPSIRQRILDRLLAMGDAAQRRDVTARLRAMLNSAAGADRLFAVANLCALEPGEGPALLAEAYGRETNQAVRVRLENLMRRSQGRPAGTL